MFNAQVTQRDDSEAYVAHEVNQPLAAIVVSAEIALEWLTREPPNLDLAKRAIERVIGNGLRAADVARSARDQVMRAPLVLVDLDINRVIDFALELRVPHLDRHGILVEAALEPALPRVGGDRVQLERLVSNLIANAVDAMANVEGRPRTLRITTGRDEAGNVLVAVKDCGSGLDPIHLARIFDPFFTTKAHGTGLGLSICRSIVESHGGELRATPNFPHGSTFSFTLPVRQR